MGCSFNWLTIRVCYFERHLICHTCLKSPERHSITPLMSLISQFKHFYLDPLWQPYLLLTRHGFWNFVFHVLALFVYAPPFPDSNHTLFISIRLFDAACGVTVHCNFDSFRPLPSCSPHSWLIILTSGSKMTAHMTHHKPIGWPRLTFCSHLYLRPSLT